MTDKVNPNRPPSTIKEFLQRSARPFGLLLLFVMICGFLAQYLTGDETLLEYADNNPDLAYGPATQTSEDGSMETAPDQQTPSSLPPSAESANSAESAAAEPSDAAEETMDTPPAYNTSEAVSQETAHNTASDLSEADKEDNTMVSDPERTIYQEGFYYEPLTDEIKQRITGISYPETGCTVPYEDLNYVGLLYIDFNGERQEGELICNKAVAQDMVEIFYELYQNEYRIESIRLIDEFNGDDTLSMEHNNTSCFNYRVVDGTTHLSKHALGCAIDINPFYNPYVVFNRNGTGETYISPKGSEAYADRSQNFPYKIDENDLCYKLFTAHGFTWGGNWNSSKDYQHFQIVLN